MSQAQILHDLMNELINEINLSTLDECVLKEFTSQPDIFTLFEKSVHFTDKEIFQTYQNLAIKQYKEGVAYSQFTDFIHLFTTKLINKAAIIINDSILIARITDISAIVMNAIAKGYLLELINDDIPALNSQLQEYVALEHINSHLEWMKQVIYDIETEAQKPSVELNAEICLFGLWTKTEEFKRFFTSHEIEDIHRMHHNVHHSGKSIYYHLKNKKYHQVLLDYLFLSRLSINLVSRLNIKITHQLLKEQIETDPLTQLRNRHSLDSVLKTTFMLHQKENISCAIAMLDIDYFKKINDTYGHQVGDMVLQVIAKLLKENVRESDMIFRYGGEEFLVLFPRCDDKKAALICEKLRLVIDNHQFDAPLQEYSITISIGISVSKDDLNTSQEVIEKADRNLYKAKREGRNKIVA